MFLVLLLGSQSVFKADKSKPKEILLNIQKSRRMAFDVLGVAHRGDLRRLRLLCQSAGTQVGAYPSGR